MDKSGGFKIVSLVSGTLIEMPVYHYLRVSISLSQYRYHYLSQIQEQMRLLDVLLQVEFLSV